MKRINKYLTSILLSTALLLGVSTVSVSANGQNHNGQQHARIAMVHHPGAQVINQSGANRIYQTHYHFVKRPGDKSGQSTKHLFNKSVHYNKVAHTLVGTFVKTKHGWINTKAFNQYLISQGPLNYRMQIIHNGNLYSAPAGITGSQKVGTTSQLNLYHQWVNVNAVATTNAIHGSYRFTYQGKTYWIPGKDLMFDLNGIRGHNRRLERIISYGEKMIGHSKYNEKSQRYDCASFLHHIFAEGGVHIGDTNTYNQMYNGRKASVKHMKRGDLVFFNTYYSTDAYGHKISGKMAHVAMYLGHGLILQDSPYTDDGGVDVTSLHDPMWNNSHSKRPEVHYLNGIVRRIL